MSVPPACLYSVVPLGNQSPSKLALQRGSTNSECVNQTSSHVADVEIIFDTLNGFRE
jgi:hypothetical protein